ncbi:hypothetical protein C8R44DRAFT_121752 [Mycena epipterygia]|nr:hypothetical protein C8R44DRAFT_121752 [Mycena epipterygia]
MPTKRPGALTTNTMRWENRMDRSANVSALCLFVCDYFLTFPHEVQYFWASRWSLVKVLFFVNRYFTMVLVVFTVYFDLYPTPDIETYVLYGPSLKSFPPYFVPLLSKLLCKFDCTLCTGTIRHLYLWSRSYVSEN